jgi:DNA-binding NtrC family response regulator
VEDLALSVKAIRLGAYDYLVKPVDHSRLILSIERAYERKGLRTGLAGAVSGTKKLKIPEAFSDTITQDPRMIELLQYADTMARSGNPFLVSGESGTGKELLARGINRGDPRPHSPFVAVNVASVPESLFEAQFFGYVKGAYTGATIDHAGYFEQGSGGTLFLDEIGELASNVQAKLLRTLEEKTIVRLGEKRPRQVDVRIVSSTNTDLDKAVKEGRFRLDLFYRLNAAHVHLPPLRERVQDIRLLANHFLRISCSRHKKDIRGFSPEAMDSLTQMRFPGNVRELAQIVERSVLLADSTLILPQHLEREPADTLSFRRKLCSLRENEEIHVAYVLTQTQGDRREAAKILGVTVRQVQRKLAQMRKDPRWQVQLGDL